MTRKESQHKWYVRNREKVMFSNRRWRLKHLEEYKEYQREYQKKRHASVKIEVLKRYSIDYRRAACVCCEESKIEFLSIDHIEKNGSLHRKSLNSRGGSMFYRWLQQNKFPYGYQTLCHNCNLGRHINKGICPHKETS